MSLYSHIIYNRNNNSNNIIDMKYNEFYVHFLCPYPYYYFAFIRKRSSYIFFIVPFFVLSRMARKKNQFYCAGILLFSATTTWRYQSYFE